MHFVEAKGIINRNRMNIYRGCQHGCIYCDSRSSCYQMKHEFTDIEAKINAPELLEGALGKRRGKCVIHTGSMSDPYIPSEEKLLLTRRCLEIIDEKGFGLGIQTKSAGILRDIDLLDSINRKAKCTVQMTLTTFDEKLCKIVEPCVSSTHERYLALKEFQKRKIPAVVWLTPLLPFINDGEENLRGILGLCADAGVRGIITFGTGLTLRQGNREYFYEQLDRFFPSMKQRYQEAFGYAYEIPSPDSAKLMEILREFCEKHGIFYRARDCFAFIGEMPRKSGQISLFD